MVKRVLTSTLALLTLITGCASHGPDPQPPTSDTAPRQVRVGQELPVSVHPGPAGRWGEPVTVMWTKVRAGVSDGIVAVAPPLLGTGILLGNDLTWLHRDADGRWQEQRLFPGMDITAVAVVPGQASGLAVWAEHMAEAAPSSGFYRSSDSGRTWQPTNEVTPFTPERAVGMLHFTDASGKGAVLTVTGAHGSAGLFISPDGLRHVIRVGDVNTQTLSGTAWSPDDPAVGFGMAGLTPPGEAGDPATRLVRVSQGGYQLQPIAGLPEGVGGVQYASSTLVVGCHGRPDGSSLCLSNDGGHTYEERPLPSGIAPTGGIRQSDTDPTMFASGAVDHTTIWYTTADLGQTWHEIRSAAGSPRALWITAFDGRDRTLYAIATSPAGTEVWAAILPSMPTASYHPPTVIRPIYLKGTWAFGNQNANTPATDGGDQHVPGS